MSDDSARQKRGRRAMTHLPVVISVEMESAEVDVLEVKDSGEVFSRSAVIVEIPIMRSGPIVEIAVSAKGDQMV